MGNRHEIIYSISRCSRLHYLYGTGTVLSKRILYLVTQCLVLTGTQIDSPISNLVVFATQPGNDIHAWKWRYVGTLVKGGDASLLGIPGVQGFTQGDIALSKSGKLLLIVSPAASQPGIASEPLWLLGASNELH